MRALTTLVFVLMPLASASRAQEAALPAIPDPTQPVVPKMVPPTPPGGTTPIPRGAPGFTSPLDRLLRPVVQLTEAGGLPSRTANENFDGDFGGVFYKRLVTVGFTTQTRVVGSTQTVTGFTPTTTSTTTQNRGIITITNTTTNTPIITTTPITVTETVPVQRLLQLTLAARYSGILITDNDSPRPQDRVYGGYNFYDGIGNSLNPGLGSVDVQRQLVGFEKTFLDGDASFGMRLPFVQQYGPGISERHVGDLTLIWKYAIINDRDTGNLWSTGLLLTTPTGGGDATLWDGSKAPHSVLFQPWTGFVRVFDRSYIQGITSFVIPTDNRDPTLWNNSIGVGYYVYRNGENRLLNAIVPTGEVHVRTPLNRRDPLGSVYLQDAVNLTGGVHFRFNRAVLSTAVCVPVVGPRPWNIEAMSFLNFYY